MAIFIHGSINSIYDKIVMSIVEMTAENASYISKKQFIDLAKEYFVVEGSFLIKERWFMPSIYGFVLRRKL
jgi:hypothetical protein